MSITALPSPPLRSDGPATFADKGDAFMAALPTFVTEANALEVNVNAKEASAVASATAAASSQIAAATASGSTKWVSGTTYAIGDVRWSPANSQSYRRKTAGAGTTDPASDSTNWAQIAGVPVQTGHAGKHLKTNGTVASWDYVFPPGTAMLFVQTAAPTGWTKSVTHNNKALRVVSGAAATGGTLSFTAAFASRTPTGTVSGSVSSVLSGSVTVGMTTLTLDEIPSHNHSIGNIATTGLSVTSPGASMATYFDGSTHYTASAGGGDAHGHTGSFSGSSANTLSASFTGNAMDFSVQYVDVIIATKD